MASDAAARRAVKAGYTDLAEMKDGIVGWDAAGQPHVPLSSYQSATAD
jgi:rhodanese-related sulfurtransferase